MQITQKQEGEVCIVSLKGDFDSGSAGEVEQSLNQAIFQGARKLLVDLDGTEYMSSAGLKVLLDVERKLKKKEGQIKLCCLRPHVKEVCNAAGFNQIFKIYNTVREGVASF